MTRARAGYPLSMNRNPRLRRCVLVSCLPVLLAVAAACANQVPNIESSPVGANVATADSINVLNVSLDPPPDQEAYHVDDSAVVRFTLGNRSAEDDRLKSIHTSEATQAQLQWDSSCSGTADPVSDIPVPAHASVPLPPDTGVVQGSPYYAKLEGIKKEIRIGTTVPLVFEFEKAGLIPVDATVQTPGAATLPPLGCHPS